jgi:hypothetical protein
VHAVNEESRNDHLKLPQIQQARAD